MEDKVLSMDDVTLEEMTGGDMVPTWDYNTQKELFGIYKGMKVNVGPNNSNIYEISTKKGVVGVWGTALLNSRFANIPVGNYIKLVYLGKTKNPKTNRMYHNFQIFTGVPKK